MFIDLWIYTCICVYLYKWICGMVHVHVYLGMYVDGYMRMCIYLIFVYVMMYRKYCRYTSF